MSERALSVFEYALLDPETATFLQRTADTIIGRTRRCAVENGKDLLEAKKRLGHGHFLTWIHAEFGWSEDTAQRQMNVALRMGELPHGAVFEDRALYLLSGKLVPEDVRQQARDRAAAGEAITHSLAKELLEAHQAQTQAESARQAALVEVQRAHEAERQARQEIADLIQRITALQEEMATLAQPEVHIQEVEKEVIPSQVTATLARLQAKVQTLTEQRNNLAKRAEQLSADLETLQGETEAKREELLATARIRKRWREVTGTFQKHMALLLGQFPSLLDTQLFEAEDWNCLEQIENGVQRFLVECRTLREAPQRVIVVDAEPCENSTP
jgi:hypothetical protein